MAKTTYVRTEKNIVKTVKGQAALVLEALETAPGPQTVEELTDTIQSLGLITRQAPERITSYYLCIFKKQGLVRAEIVEDAVPEDNDEVVEVEETEDEFAEVE